MFSPCKSDFFCFEKIGPSEVYINILAITVVPFVTFKQTMYCSSNSFLKKITKFQDYSCQDSNLPLSDYRKETHNQLD